MGSDENLNNLAFICSPNPHCDQNGNGATESADTVTPTTHKETFNKDTKDFDENCEVLSVSSAGPSPVKLLDVDGL